MALKESFRVEVYLLPKVRRALLRIRLMTEEARFFAFTTQTKGSVESTSLPYQKLFESELQMTVQELVRESVRVQNSSVSRA